MMRPLLIGAVVSVAALAAPAAAQDAAPASDTMRFVLDTALLFVAGVGVLIALTGLCMRDVGLARPQHMFSVCLRTLSGLGVSALAFWLVGYNLIYAIEDGGLLGEFRVWTLADNDPAATGRASGVFWFFQMGLAALAAVVVSGAVSERVRFWPYLVFTAALSGVIYPIAASWVRGVGYISQSWGFYDYGGGTVHIAAGAAALAGAIVVGPRPGKYVGGKVRRAEKTALQFSALGAALFLIGWLLATAGMEGSLSSVEAAISISTAAVNSVVAVAGGVLTALVMTKVVYKRSGLVSVISGSIAALVSLAADPVSPAVWQAAMIGAVGGVIVTVTPPFLDRYRIDDAGFVAPAHLLCGIWGAAIVPWTNANAWLQGQFIGVAAIAGFTFFMSLLLWVALKYTAGVRLTPLDEPEPAPAANG